MGSLLLLLFRLSALFSFFYLSNCLVCYVFPPLLSSFHIKIRTFLQTHLHSKFCSRIKGLPFPSLSPLLLPLSVCVCLSRSFSDPQVGAVPIRDVQDKVKSGYKVSLPHTIFFLSLHHFFLFMSFTHPFLPFFNVSLFLVILSLL